jgi:hypothetical protein
MSSSEFNDHFRPYSDDRWFSMQHISFANFAKLCAAIGFAFGIGMGVVGLVLSAFGAGSYVTTNLLGLTVTGVWASVLMPVVMVLLSFVVSILGFLPFRLFMRNIGGLRLESLQHEQA